MFAKEALFWSLAGYGNALGTGIETLGIAVVLWSATEAIQMAVEIWLRIQLL
jgi:hypothetical protein